MIFAERINKDILNWNKMKTINKFSGTLLLMTAILLCSYVLMHNGSTGVTKAITNVAVNTPTGTPAIEHGIKMDSTIKTRKASCACGRLSVTVVGPDPERRSLCNCHLCQKQSGSVFSVQARFPKEQVTIEGKATAWKFPPANAVKPVTGRTCGDGGGTFYFCPVCGTTVYYTVDADPARIGIKVGCFADPTFPPPMIAGFEEYMYRWALNVSALPMPGGHHQ
jgi:hypothetical protein